MNHLRHVYLLISCLFFTGCMLTRAQGRPKSKTKQIDALLKEKNSRTPAERKIDSQLLQAIRKYTGDKTADAGMDSVGVHPAPDGSIMIDISAAVTDDLLSIIKKQGGEVLYASKQYNSVRARVPISAVREIAGRDQVTFIRAASLPMLSTGSIPGKTSQ